MKVQFNNPIQISANGKSETFHSGIHEVDEQLVDCWYFEALVQSGQIIPMEKFSPQGLKHNVPYKPVAPLAPNAPEAPAPSNAKYPASEAKEAEAPKRK